MTASLIATVIGISLTFGIDSCSEQRRIVAEVKKSMLQASDNIKERFDAAQKWMEIIGNQNRVYRVADSTFRADGQLSDSLSLEFRMTMPYIRISAHDHEFEKLFRGSYQIWQIQHRNDSLVYYIGSCYDALNTVESLCSILTESMLDKIGDVNAEKHFYRTKPEQWTETLITDPDFQYYMSIRRVKTTVAADILRQAWCDYQEKILPRCDEFR